MAEFKAVFFDLDGTLRIPTPSPTGAFIELAESMDIDISAPLAKRLKLWAHHYWGQDEQIKQDLARYGEATFWLNYSKLLLEMVEAKENIDSRALLVRDWFINSYDPHVALAAGSVELLQFLKKSGYVLGLISNRNNSLQQTVRELELDIYFDYCVAAGEIGYWKPNPGIFYHVLQQFGALQAADCLYVGDNYYADGHGAKAAGLVPVIFDPENIYDTTCEYWRITHMDDLRTQLI